MGCFIFKRRKIHIWQERLLAFICAISSGLFAFFFTGRIFLAIEYELPQKATLTIQATGGLAIFVLVLFWWFKASASPTSKIPSIPPNPTDEKLISALVSQSEVKGQLQFEINGLKRQLSKAIERIKELEAKGQYKQAYQAIEDVRKSGDMAKLQSLLIEDRDRHQNEMIQRNREIAAVAYLRGNIDVAENAIDEILKCLPDDPFAINQKGHINRTLGKLKAAHNSFSRMLNAAVERGDKISESVALSNLGSIYMTQNKIGEAEELYCKALEISMDQKDVEGQAYDYCNVARIYRERKEFQKAIDFFRKSLKLSKITKDQHLQAAILGNIGICYESLGNLSVAEKMYSKALGMEKEIGFKRAIADTLHCLGSLYLTQNRLTDAITTLKKSLETAKAMGYKSCMSKAYTGLGLTYLGLREINEAKKMHKESLKIESELNSKEGMARQYFNLGVLYSEQGDIKTAKESTAKAYILYQDIGKPEMAEYIQKRIEELNFPPD